MSRSTDTENLTELALWPLAGASFAPYGHVVAPGDTHSVPANAGTALRHDIVRLGADSRPASRLVLSVFETEPQALPLMVRLVERHPHSEQAIVGMGMAEFACVVARDDGAGRPDPGTLRAFHCPPGRGVVYGRGVWHSPIIGLSRPGRFFVQSWQDGTAGDCEEIAIPPLLIRRG